MKKPSKSYVYIYLDPRRCGEFRYGDYAFDYEPFYVGKGQNYRYKGHLYKRTNRHMQCKISAIKKVGLVPVIQVLWEGLQHIVALQLEMQLICLIGRNDTGAGPLLNFTDGGEGSVGRITSEQTRQLLSVVNTGKKASPETIQRMSEARQGHLVAEDTRQKIAAKLKGHTINVGRRHSDEAKAKMRKPKTPEAVANMTRARRERVGKMTDEVKQKISNSLKGRKLSEDAKAKLRGHGPNSGSFVKGQVPWNKGLSGYKQPRA